MKSADNRTITDKNGNVLYSEQRGVDSLLSTMGGLYAAEFANVLRGKKKLRETWTKLLKGEQVSEDALQDLHVAVITKKKSRPRNLDDEMKGLLTEVQILYNKIGNDFTPALGLQTELRKLRHGEFPDSAGLKALLQEMQELLVLLETITQIYNNGVEQNIFWPDRLPRESQKTLRIFLNDRRAGGEPPITATLPRLKKLLADLQKQAEDTPKRKREPSKAAVLKVENAKLQAENREMRRMLAFLNGLEGLTPLLKAPV